MINQSIVKIGMAEFNTTSQSGILKTTGLGSCVGLTLYDPFSKIAGMAHIMLPSSAIAREGRVNIGKYADTVLPELIAMMTAQGASLHRFEAKMAGGAQMFSFGGSDTMRIGPRNVESCKLMLQRYKITLLAEDTGGNYGRTIEFYSESGKLIVRSVNQGEKEY